jgi:hypothetical protein
VDSTGIAYLAGTTNSVDFPATAGAFQTTVLSSGYQYAFVAKMNAALSKLTYSTYLAGTGTAYSYGSVTATGLAVDATGQAFVVGVANILDFPLISPLVSQPPPNQIYGYPTAAFLSVLNSTGSALTYSTLFSGSKGAAGAGVAVDQASHAVITGWTADFDLPTTAGAFQSTIAPSTNYFTQHGFVTEILMNQANASACFSTNLVYLASNYGKPSVATPFTVTNCGTAPLKITAMTTSNPVFTVAKGACTTLAAGTSCTAHVKYTPMPNTYSDSGTVSITDNAPVSPQNLGLAGYVNYAWVWGPGGRGDQFARILPGPEHGVRAPAHHVGDSNRRLCWRESLPEGSPARRCLQRWGHLHADGGGAGGGHAFRL